MTPKKVYVPPKLTPLSSEDPRVQVAIREIGELSIPELEKRRKKLARKLESVSRDSEEGREIWQNLVAVSQMVTDRQNQEHVTKLQLGTRARFDAFVANGFHFHDFSPALYRALHVCFGNWAHTDRHGFFAIQFSTLERQIQTLENMMHWTPSGYMAELETELQETIRDESMLDFLKRTASLEKIARERKELTRLLEKYHGGLLPEPERNKVLDKLHSWGERARCAQVALDLSKDPESVAIQAGQLLDLTEDMENFSNKLLSEFDRVLFTDENGQPLPMQKATSEELKRSEQILAMHPPTNLSESNPSARVKREFSTKNPHPFACPCPYCCDDTYVEPKNIP